ncbi:hypothetical protein [Asanoa siamensis]|uniref:DUF2207 domain-containing protein n=1 Tax=Asanoa siamensis TaxID=926357 RepID=A0ABQ4D1X3_9ACTN|nr:hypothetical protein [Asanoa siamensis]GIF77540.1 hypothetical protein Asi02nite_70580 [Asanoa siamensis]
MPLGGLSGPEFLALYLALSAVAIGGTLLVQARLRSGPAQPRYADVGPREAGYLRRGPWLAVHAAPAALRRVEVRHHHLRPEHRPSYATYDARSAAMAVALFGAYSLYLLDPAFAAAAEVPRQAAATTTGGASGIESASWAGGGGAAGASYGGGGDSSGGGGGGGCGGGGGGS